MSYALFAWLLLLNFGKLPLVPELDPSYVAASTFLAAEPARYGRDVLFNYGPLSPLAYSTFDGRIYGRFFVLELLCKGFAVLVICRLAWRQPGFSRWLFLLTVLVVGLMNWQPFYLFSVAGVALILWGRSALDRALAVPGLVFLAALALVKATFLTFGVLAVVCVAWGEWRRGPRRWAWWPLAAFGFALGLLWLLLGQHLGDLPRWVRGGLEITDGYSRAMALAPAPGVLAWGLTALALAAGQVLGLLWRDRREPAALPVATLLGGALFLAWKQGFVRADAHVGDFFRYAALSAAAAPLFFGSAVAVAQRWRGALFHGVAFALVLVTVLWGERRQGDLHLVRDVGVTLRNRWHGNLLVLSDPRAEAVRQKDAILASRRTLRLPQTKRVVGGASVDVFGFEQAIAIANQFRYVPSPDFQSYNAYTPFLDRANEEFYASGRAPEFTLFKLNAINAHLPTAEGARQLLSLARFYRIELSEHGYLLLWREAPAPAATLASADLRPLATGELPRDGVLSLPPLPADALGIWCELELPESWPGRLLTFLYQQGEVYLKLGFGDAAAPGRWRLVPKLAAGGFLLAPLVESTRDLATLQAGRPTLLVPRTLSLTDGGTGVLRREFASRWRYRLFSVPRPAAPIREAAARFLDLPSPQSYAGVFSTPPDRLRSNSAASERFTVDGQAFLLVHAPGEVEWELPGKARKVRGKFAFRPGAWEGGETDGAEFRVEFQPGDGRPGVVLLSRLLRPRAEPADRGAQSFEVELPPEVDAGGGRLILRTLPGPAGDTSWDWTGWGDVRIE